MQWKVSLAVWLDWLQFLSLEVSLRPALQYLRSKLPKCRTIGFPDSDWLRLKSLGLIATSAERESCLWTGFRSHHLFRNSRKMTRLDWRRFGPTLIQVSGAVTQMHMTQTFSTSPGPPEFQSNTECWSGKVFRVRMKWPDRTDADWIRLSCLTPQFVTYEGPKWQNPRLYIYLYPFKFFLLSLSCFLTVYETN